MSDMAYLEAFELLVEKSGWARSEVARDPESAAGFIAARADTPHDAKEAQAAGRIVSSGKP